MDIHFIWQVCDLMQAVTDLTGLPVSWKSANGIWYDNRIPYHQCLRYNSFCMGVKRKKHLEEKCLNNTGPVIEERSRQQQGNFINHCHAGVSELIIPLFKGDLYDGYISMGPFRMPGWKSPFQWAKKDFDELPEYAEEKCTAAEKLLDVLGQYILEQKSRIILRQLTADIRDPRIRQALEYIKVNYRKELTVDDLAGECCLSPSRFIHLFKEQTGITFSNYLVQCKIEEAKNLLGGSNMSIYNVGFHSGFMSQSYFGSIFRKYTGMTPREYRRKYQEEFAAGSTVMSI